MKKSSLLVLISLLAAAGAQAATPTRMYVSIEGARQGKFRGEVTSRPHAGTVEATRISYSVTAPRDPATGMASGKRQHSPVVITKEWGASSPQILSAIISNEVLKSVKIEFVRATATGEEETYSTITLTNAAITSVKQTEDSYSATAGDKLNLQDVSISFQHIEVSDANGVGAVDDTHTP